MFTAQQARALTDESTRKGKYHIIEQEIEAIARAGFHKHTVEFFQDIEVAQEAAEYFVRLGYIATVRNEFGNLKHHQLILEW